MSRIKSEEEKAKREQRLKDKKAKKRYVSKDQRNQSVGVTGPAGSKPKA